MTKYECESGTVGIVSDPKNFCNECPVKMCASRGDPELKKIPEKKGKKKIKRNN